MGIAQRAYLTRKPSQEQCLKTINSVISRHQKQRLTYEELDLKSNALARGFQDIGVKKGERVAVSLGNNIEYATVWQPALNWNQC